MKDIFSYKSIAADATTIKDVDTEKGIVTGYFSAFGSIDSDNDMIMPGAYKKTLQENANRVKHLWQHDVRYPLSKPTTLKEDSYGLYFESEISKTSYGKDVLQLYKDGVIDEHSVGFKTINKSQKSNYTEITEIRLWEGSTVTFGANPNTPFTGMKGASAEDVMKKMDSVLKTFRNGRFENEEIFDALEVYFKQLQQLFIELTTKSTQPVEETVEPEQIDVALAIKQFTQSLKN
jgi:HK97 family phage prohead protease